MKFSISLCIVDCFYASFMQTSFHEMKRLARPGVPNFFLLFALIQLPFMKAVSLLLLIVIIKEITVV